MALQAIFLLPPDRRSPLARQLAALFDTRETLTNSQAAALTNANRSTLKAKFNELLSAGLIEAHGKGRGAFYARRKIARLVPQV